MVDADFLLTGIGQLCTMAPEGAGEGPLAGPFQGRVGAIEGAAVAAYRGRLVAVGKEEEVLARVRVLPRATVLHARGRLVTPGMVDSHTHLCFAGWRAEEFSLRVQGADYLEILQKGGGILQTVQATRRASEEELVVTLKERALQALRQGVTTIEVKSGYGLSWEAERKQLRAIRRVKEELRGRMDVVATFLGAHAVPPEYRGKGSEYARKVAEEMVPRVAAEGWADFVDVFCEKGVFSVDESRLILEAAAKEGLGRKIHADEVHPLGGSRLAAEVGAMSADHLVATTREDMALLREAGVVACLLPATSFFLMKEAHAPARTFIDEGVPVALATDMNPGTQPNPWLLTTMTLGCLLYRMTPEEVLVAVTRNAAAALGLLQDRGSVEEGKKADLVIWDCPTYHHLPYRWGVNLAAVVIKEGQVVVDEG